MLDDAAQGSAEPRRFAPGGWAFPVAAAVSMFVLAALALSKFPAMGDAAELTLALALAGIPHPTGYPLYVLGGHLFVRALHAANFSWVVAASLWSAAGAAVALGAFARCVQHVIAATLDEHEVWPPLVGVGLVSPVIALALNPVWIANASGAEVYSWSDATLFVAAAFMLGKLRSLEDASPPADRATVRTALRWGLLCGVCLTFHLTSAAAVVAMTTAIVAAHARLGRWRLSHALIGLAAALLPLASYGWIAWRAAHPAAFQWPVEPTFASWWMHVSGAAYTHFLGGFSPSETERQLIRVALLPFILPGIGLGAVFALRARSWALRWGLLSLLAGSALQILFVSFYSVPDASSYFLPSLMASLLIGGSALLSTSRRLSIAALSMGAVLVIGLGAWSFTRVVADRKLLAQVDAGIRDAWKRVPFDRGIVLWADDHYHRFVLLQVLEGQRPDLYVDDPDMLSWPPRRRAFERRFGFDPLGGRPIRSPGDIERISQIIRERAKVPVLILPQ